MTDAAGATELGPDDLERLATAAYFIGHDDASTDAWSRVNQGWLGLGRQERAVRCGSGWASGLQHGEMAWGGGWPARAARLVEQHRLECVERGYRLLPEALTYGGRDAGVACGTGVATRLAAEAVGSRGSVAGLNVNPGMLEVARAAAPAGTAIEWHQGSAEKLPLPDASFDVVLCSLGFMFFPAKVEALREMRRVLVPGGRVLLGTPGPTPPLFEAIDRAPTAHVGPGASMFVHAVFSVHDPAEIRDLMDTAGFEEVETETGTVPLPVAPPAEFFWQYVHSTPLAAIVGELDGPPVSGSSTT